MTELLTYSMQQSISGENNWSSASQEFPRTVWNRRFINAFTSARHPSLSCATFMETHIYITNPVCKSVFKKEAH